MAALGRRSSHKAFLSSCDYSLVKNPYGGNYIYMSAYLIHGLRVLRHIPCRIFLLCEFGFQSGRKQTPSRLGGQV